MKWNMDISLRRRRPYTKHESRPVAPGGDGVCHRGSHFALFTTRSSGQRVVVNIGRQLLQAVQPILYGAFIAYLLSPMVDFSRDTCLPPPWPRPAARAGSPGCPGGEPDPYLAGDLCSVSICWPPSCCRNSATCCGSSAARNLLPSSAAGSSTCWNQSR